MRFGSSSNVNASGSVTGAGKQPLQQGQGGRVAASPGGDSDVIFDSIAEAAAAGTPGGAAGASAVAMKPPYKLVVEDPVVAFVTFESAATAKAIIQLYSMGKLEWCVKGGSALVCPPRYLQGSIPGTITGRPRPDQASSSTLSAAGGIGKATTIAAAGSATTTASSATASTMSNPMAAAASGSSSASVAVVPAAAPAGLLSRLWGGSSNTIAVGKPSSTPVLVPASGAARTGSGTTVTAPVAAGGSGKTITVVVDDGNGSDQGDDAARHSIEHRLAASSSGKDGASGTGSIIDHNGGGLDSDDRPTLLRVPLRYLGQRITVKKAPPPDTVM